MNVNNLDGFEIANDAWLVWDNPGDGRGPLYNPSKTVKIQPAVGSSWITMSNDGKLAFVADGSIIDVRAHKVTGQNRDQIAALKAHGLGASEIGNGGDRASVRLPRPCCLKHHVATVRKSCT